MVRFYTLNEWEEMILEELDTSKETTIGALCAKFKTSRVTIKPAIEVLKSKGKLRIEYRGRSVVYCLEDKNEKSNL